MKVRNYVVLKALFALYSGIDTFQCVVLTLIFSLMPDGVFKEAYEAIVGEDDS